MRAILDHREVAGVGCVLSNQAGRWFVTAPGRVTIRKSVGDLAVDCKKDGVGAATRSGRLAFRHRQPDRQCRRSAAGLGY